MKLKNPKTGEILESDFENDRDAAEELKTVQGEFPETLCRYVRSGYNLSSAQQFWLHKLAMQRKENWVRLSFDKLQLHFNAAKEAGLLFPKLQMKMPDWTMTITDDGAVKIGYRTWGTFNVKEGTFFFREKKEEALKLLAFICAEPILATKTIGIQTGRCCCCGATLTNPLSIELGIGPICRAKWGM